MCIIIFIYTIIHVYNMVIFYTYVYVYIYICVYIHTYTYVEELERPACFVQLNFPCKLQASFEMKTTESLKQLYLRILAQ